MSFRILLHKKLCHVLTDTKQCINKAIHVLLIHDLVVLLITIPGTSQSLMSSSVKCTVVKAICDTKMKLSFALEAAFSKHLQVMCLSVPL